MDINKLKKIYKYTNYGTKYNNIYYENNDIIILKLENKKDGIKYAIFDKEDFEKIKICNWKLRKDSKTYYALNSRYGFVHRHIMQCPDNMQVDHINGNGLDNRKINLRVVSNYENSRNKVNSIGIYIVNDNRKKKYRVIWRENNKQKSKGFEVYNEALVFRKYIEKEIYKRPETYAGNGDILKMFNIK